MKNQDFLFIWVSFFLIKGLDFIASSCVCRVRSSGRPFELELVLSCMVEVVFFFFLKVG